MKRKIQIVGWHKKSQKPWSQGTDQHNRTCRDQNVQYNAENPLSIFHKVHQLSIERPSPCFFNSPQPKCLHQTVLFCHFLEGWKRTLNLLIRNTVSDPDITRACKGTARNNQNVVFLTYLAEFFLILYRRFHKQVKCALGLDAGKSILTEGRIQKIPVPVISL